MLLIFLIQELAGNANLLSTAANLATVVSVCVVCWGYRNFWAKFKKQKRIENLTNNAKQALDHVTQVEDIIMRLFMEIQKTVKNPNERPHQLEHLKLHAELFDALRKLRDALSVLRNGFSLERNPLIFEWLKKLNEVLSNQYTNFLPAFNSIEIANMFGFPDIHCLDIELNRLRDTLLEIHEVK